MLILILEVESPNSRLFYFIHAPGNALRKVILPFHWFEFRTNKEIYHLFLQVVPKYRHINGGQRKSQGDPLRVPGTLWIIAGGPIARG